MHWRTNSVLRKDHGMQRQLGCDLCSVLGDVIRPSDEHPYIFPTPHRAAAPLSQDATLPPFFPSLQQAGRA